MPHEGWLEDHRYLNMEFLKEQKKELRPPPNRHGDPPGIGRDRQLA